MTSLNGETISTFPKKKKSAYTTLSVSDHDDVEFAGHTNDGEIVVQGELVPSIQDITGCRRKHLLFAGVICFIIFVNLLVVATSKIGANEGASPVSPLQNQVEDGDDVMSSKYDFKNHDGLDSKVESITTEVDDSMESESEVEEEESKEVEMATKTSNFENTKHEQENESPQSKAEEDEDTTDQQQKKDKKSWWDTVTGWFSGKDDRPTKLPGGGRDWLVNAKEGTISPKHDPSFYLGYGPNELKLVTKDSKNKIIFQKENDDDSDEWMKLSIFGSSPDQVSYVGMYPGAEASVLSGVKYYNTIASSWADPFRVKYIDDNYIATEDDFVLDVAFWNIVEGSAVNFIKMDDGTSYTAGGGRDFTWNEDGSISPSLNPELVIGLAPAGLVITKEKDQAIHFKHAQDLANGNTVPFEFVGNGISNAVGFTDEDTYDRWRYRLSVLFSQSENDDDSLSVVDVKYDGNFVLTDDESYALDISFWNMESWNSVNFVGGDDD